MSPVPGLLTILGLAVTNLRNTAGYVAPTGGAGTVVYDGPPALGQDAPLTYVCIGWVEGGDTSGTMHTSAAAMGARADRLEEGTFDAMCVASAGDTDPSTLRATLKQTVADLTTAVYGLTDASFAAYWCEVSSLDYRSDQNTAGVTLSAAITFAYRVQQGA